jgi:restriction system protein
MTKRGFFAELQHQNQLAARRNQQAANQAARNQAAAQRRAAQAAREAERARAQHARAVVADKKRSEEEARRLHIEAMQAKADSLNAILASEFGEIDSILEIALSVENFVDLEELRAVAVHPPFSALGLEQPIAPPAPVMIPPEPQFIEPQGPTGLGSVFGKKHHAEEVAKARAGFEAQHLQWQAEAGRVPALQLQQMQTHQLAEKDRLGKLKAARSAYDAECQERAGAIELANKRLDSLILRLQQNEESAVQEYVSIVLGNSVYPDCFPVSYEFEFNAGLKELSLIVIIPKPSSVSSLKEYRYNKAKDELVPMMLTQKQVRDRYAGAVHAVALRTLHEIFEGDRDGRIRTISLTVATEDVNRATGRAGRVPLVVVAIDRETFATFDLSNVVPEATLGYLKALVSKNPHDLAPIDGSRGVRSM